MVFQSSLSAVKPAGQSVTSNLKQSIVTPSNGSVGFILIMLATFISGFAGTFTEKVLKGSKNSIWANNFQMSFFSLIPASLPMVWQLISSFASTTSTFAPFDAFTGWAWTVVFLNIVGGLLVAMAVKYADSILKSFAASVAVILTFFITYFFMGSTFTLPSLFGAALVIVAVLAYNQNYANSDNIQITSPQIAQYEQIPSNNNDGDDGDDDDDREMRQVTVSSPSKDSSVFVIAPSSPTSR
jgi:UDP-galactose transporter